MSNDKLSDTIVADLAHNAEYGDIELSVYDVVQLKVSRVAARELYAAEVRARHDVEQELRQKTEECERLKVNVADLEGTRKALKEGREILKEDLEKAKNEKANLHTSLASARIGTKEAREHLFVEENLHNEALEKFETLQRSVQKMKSGLLFSHGKTILLVQDAISAFERTPKKNHTNDARRMLLEKIQNILQERGNKVL